jgi:putative ABC transport system permease protein
MLSILGVIFGIASVIALISMGEGVKAQITEQVQSLGANTLVIRSGEPISEEEGLTPAQIEQMQKPSLSSSTITLKDLEKVRESQYVEGAYPLIEMTYQVEAEKGGEGKSTTVMVVGTDHQYKQMRGKELAHGEFLEEGVKEGQAVLGNSLAKTLFGSDGKDVLKKKISYKCIVENKQETRDLVVVGIMAQQPKVLMSNPNVNLYVSIGDAQRMGGGSDESLLSIEVKIKQKDYVEDAKLELERAIKKNHGGKTDFNIQSQEELMSTYNNIFNILSALVVGVASISLVEGGIGVANIMYVSVKERTKEIGVRLAQGASKKVVITQFLLESVLLCLVGALIGIPLGIITAVMIDKLTVLPATPTIWSIFVAFGAAFLVGVVAGVFPARQATRVEITEALRAE